MRKARLRPFTRHLRFQLEVRLDSKVSSVDYDPFRQAVCDAERCFGNTLYCILVPFFLSLMGINALRLPPFLYVFLNSRDLTVQFLKAFITLPWHLATSTLRLQYIAPL